MKKLFSGMDLSKTSILIKRTLFCVSFVFICTFIYIVCSVTINNVKKSIEDQYNEDGRTITKSYALAFENFLIQLNNSIDIFTIDEVFKNGSTAQISNYLITRKNLLPPFILNLFYVEEDGTAHYTENSEKYKDINLLDREYINAIFNENHKFYLNSPVISKSTGEPIIIFAKAIYDKNENLKGCLAVSVLLSYVYSLLANEQIEESFHPFIIDGKGIMVSHREPNLIMKVFDPAPDDETIPSTTEMAKSEENIFNGLKYNTNEKMLIFLEKIKQTDWKIGIAIPDEKIHKTYKQLEKSKNATFLIVILAGILFYLFTKAALLYARKLYEAMLKLDPITELITRQNFEYQAAKLIEENPKGQFVLFEADIVGFKFINRNYGDKAGNEVLLTLASILKDLCFAHGGIVARGYADHFYYFNKISSFSKLAAGLKTYQKKIQKIASSSKYPFTTKYGISFMIPQKDGLINSGKKSISQLIGEASLAKNTIKNKSDTPYAIFNTQMAQRVLQEQKIERVMEKALKNGEFFVVYQPKIDLLTDKIIGAEALVRWNSQELGFLSPDKFIPLFEQNGFIKKLDFAVYEMVFKFIKSRIDNNEKIVQISVNMSRNHINTNSFMKEFMHRFEKYNIPPSLIEIEILERSISEEKPILREITQELHKHGFSVAMDDFGSGESSLNMLNSVPIDVLKFDQNFLRTNDIKKTEQFITSLITMAQQMQKKTVFEGVETENQRNFLKSIRCDCVQGFFYSKPLQETDFIKFMNEHS